MSDDRVTHYLRQRGRATPPHDLVANVMVAIDSAPVARSQFTAFLPAFVAVGAAAVIAVLALILGPSRDIGPAPTPSAPAEAAQPATVDELREAVMAALDALRGKPGVEGVGTNHVLDEVGSVTWFSWRPNGDQVVVNRSDVDVTETGWWRDPTGAPPSRGSNISTTIQVLAGENYYFAQGDVNDADHWGWARGIRSDFFDILGVPFPAALDGRLNPWRFAPAPDGEATVASLADGGEVWTATSPLREGLVVQEFVIGPDGALRTVSHELIGVSPALEEPPFTSAFVELTALEDPGPIPQPDTGSPPDPAAFGMPDLQLDPAQARIDYRAYVEQVLDVIEAYHWDSENVDWAAARSAALDGLPEEPTAGQAHQRILNAIQTFDTFGTHFARPQDVPPGSDAPEVTTLPEAERFGDIGYLRLPSYIGTDAGALTDYVTAAREAMDRVNAERLVARQGIESNGCGWVVDLRSTTGRSAVPLLASIVALLDEGRVITYRSQLGEWWLEVDASWIVLRDERRLDGLDSELIAAVLAGAPLQARVDAAALETLPAGRSLDATAGPVAILTSPVTAGPGEQVTVALRALATTRHFGGVTAGAPQEVLIVRLVDGAELRVPTGVPVASDGTPVTGNLVPDEVVAITGSTGGDPVLEGATEWLEGQPDCP